MKGANLTMLTLGLLFSSKIRYNYNARKKVTTFYTDCKLI